MHAAGAQQAHHVDGLAVLNGGLHGIHDGLVLADGAVLNGLGDAGQFLVHDAARTDVGVAHLAVAHLAVGQAHVHAGSADGGVGAAGEQLVQVGGIGGHDGVAVGFAGHPAEAVQDAEHQGLFRHKRRSSLKQVWRGLCSPQNANRRRPPAGQTAPEQTKEKGRLLAGSLHDGGKSVRLQGGAADQAAVHVGFGNQLVGVAGVHAAAVLDGGSLGHGLAVHFAQHLADSRADFLAWSLVAVLPVPMAQTGS